MSLANETSIALPRVWAEFFAPPTAALCIGSLNPLVILKSPKSPFTLLDNSVTGWLIFDVSAPAPPGVAQR